MSNNDSVEPIETQETKPREETEASLETDVILEDEEIDSLDEFLEKELSIGKALKLVKSKMPNGYRIEKKFFEGLYTYLFILKAPEQKTLSAIVTKPTEEVEIIESPVDTSSDDDLVEQDN